MNKKDQHIHSRDKLLKINLKFKDNFPVILYNLGNISSEVFSGLILVLVFEVLQ